MRRLTNLKTTSAEGKTLQNIAYSYDEVGNILSRRNSEFNTTDNVSRNSEQSYTYDNRDRLTSSGGKFDYETWNPFWNKRVNTYSSDFEYNITGKILRKNQENKGLIEDTGETVTIGETTYDWNYEYGGAQPNAVTKAGTRTFSYDLNGNMTMMGPLTPTGGTGADVTRTLLWDEENRLKKTTDASGSNSIVTTYGYGADGMRAVKKGKYGTVQYVSENYVVRNKDLISKHVFAGNTRLVSNMVMQEEKSGKMVSTEQGCYYYHADHLGSSSVVTDKDGEFYEQIEYFPYGETWVHNKATSDDSAQSTPYKFTGKELDPETGLYYYGYRYFDPKLSRWTSADPPMSTGEYFPVPPINDSAKNQNANLPGMGGVFSSVNMDVYHFAGQNPVKYVDPDGREDVIFVKSASAKNARLESEALAYKDGTFKSDAYKALKGYAAFKESFGIKNSLSRKEVESFLGKPDASFDNFSTLPDDPVEYGTIQSGKELSYSHRETPMKKMDAFLLTDPTLGGGKVPQDKNFGDPVKGIGKNPSFSDRTPAYLFGAYMHTTNKYGTGTSWGCLIQKGFESPGGLGHYLNNSPTGKTGNVIIFR